MTDQGLHGQESEDIGGGADEEWQRFNILSLDGGGIRGYWSLLVLQKLMENIAAKEEEDDETFHSFHPQAWPRDVSIAPLTKEEKNRVSKTEDEEDKARALQCARRYLPCHYFDNICGSSTGGLIAIMLGRLRMTVPDCIYEYKSLGQEVFGKPRFFTTLRFGVGDRCKYNAANLTKVFKEVTKRHNEKPDGEFLGKITFPSRKGLCTTFVTTRTTLGALRVDKEYLIRSYDHDKEMKPNDSIDGPSRTNTAVSAMSERPNAKKRDSGLQLLNYEKAQEFEIWQVARAATAAEFYFEPLKVEKARTSGDISFTDGGFSLINNPTRLGLQEIKSLHGSKSTRIVISVGTARRERVDKSSRWRQFFDRIPRSMKDMAYQKSDPEVVHEEMRQEQERQDFTYYRLNHKDGLGIEFDNWEPKQGWYNKEAGSKTISIIDNAFGQWASEVTTINNLQDCANKLVECRRKRMQTPKWERFATGAHYRCPYQHCGFDVFEGEKFKAHLIKHGTVEEELKNEMDRCRDCWRYQAKWEETG